MPDPTRLLLDLTSFTPGRVRAPTEEWLAMSALAGPHGVAPLIGHNLEYRLGGSDAPAEVRDVLLSHYQGAMADNVYKLVNLKQLLTRTAQLPVMLLDAAATADSLYPHVAFRPVEDIRLLCRPGDCDALLRTLEHAGFRAVREPDRLGAEVVTFDDRTRIAVHTSLFPRGAEGEDVWERSLPARGYGPAVRRPSPEDAVLSGVLFRAREAFDSPLIGFLDLRELLRGAPDLGGPYSQPLNGSVLRGRAVGLRLQRALWAGLTIVTRLFPELSATADAAAPTLRPATMALLDRVVVARACDLHRSRTLRGAERLRRLLAGG